jgi:hypothetical protein
MQYLILYHARAADASILVSRYLMLVGRLIKRHWPRV